MSRDRCSFPSVLPDRLGAAVGRGGRRSGGAPMAGLPWRRLADLHFLMYPPYLHVCWLAPCSNQPIPHAFECFSSVNHPLAHFFLSFSFSFLFALFCLLLPGWLRDYRFKAETAASGVLPPGIGCPAGGGQQPLPLVLGARQGKQHPLLLELRRNTAPPEIAELSRSPPIQAPAPRRRSSDDGEVVRVGEGESARRLPASLSA